MTVRHAPSLQNFVNVQLLVSTNSSGYGASVMFDGQIPVDWSFRSHLDACIAVCLEFLCQLRTICEKKQIIIHVRADDMYANWIRAILVDSVVVDHIWLYFVQMQDISVQQVSLLISLIFLVIYDFDVHALVSF